MCLDAPTDVVSLTRGITTIELAPMRAAQQAKFAALAQNGAKFEFLHTLPTGETLMSSAVATPQEGTIVLHGSIGPFPYEIEITVKLEGDAIIVRLHVKKPIELGPYEWKFDLTGIVRDSTNKIVGASGLVPSASQKAMSLNWWCVLRCGGISILGVLVKCLPSLAGGPAAYIACVTSSLGTAAAAVAACIAQKCT